MTLIARIDSRLIAVPYQWLVDKSQRERVWWIQQSCMLLVVEGIMNGGLRDKWLGAVCSMIVAAVFLLVCNYRQEMLDIFGEDMRLYRYMILVLVMVSTPLNIFLAATESALNIIPLLSDVAMMSLYYFAACKPPAPPKRREEHDFQPAPEGGGT